MNKFYIAIDLKSFYASVECLERGLDPMNTNLVVADSERTEKTICLAVTPTLKMYGLSGRSRLFEVIQKVKNANAVRSLKINRQSFEGKSHIHSELTDNAKLQIDYIIAKPQMAHYIKVSAKIYEVYLKYIAPEDMHVYSIDEVFIDASKYLKTYNTSAVGLAKMIIKDVFDTTGITATAGVGTNLYLCKIAMDILAKRTQPDENGMRVAFLNEMLYKKQLWDHRPITDFWRIGKGYARRLEEYRIYTMGDVARCSLGEETAYHSEELLYKLFGVNAELLIDHAWGYEPCTIEQIKSYKPKVNSINMGQVLKEPYNFEKAQLVVREMAEMLALDLVEKTLVTDQIVLTVGYDIDNIKNGYKGETFEDAYGRTVPKHAHGTHNLEMKTSSTKLIVSAVTQLFNKIVNPNLLVRRMNIVAGKVIKQSEANAQPEFEQLDFFAQTKETKIDKKQLEREKKRQEAILKIQKKYGKNAILKGINLEEGATAKERNSSIGGHKA